MTAAPTDPIVREIDVDAPPETVFEFFVDADKLTRWLATDATLDPRTGGICRLDQLRAWGRRRGWQGLRLVSAHGTSFTTDLGTEGSRGGQVPAVSVFTRDGDEVRHSYTQSAELPGGRAGGMDLIWPLWHVLDLLPSGRGEWLPDNTYPGALRGETHDAASAGR